MWLIIPHERFLPTPALLILDALARTRYCVDRSLCIHYLVCSFNSLWDQSCSVGWRVVWYAVDDVQPEPVTDTIPPVSVGSFPADSRGEWSSKLAACVLFVRWWEVTAIFVSKRVLLMCNKATTPVVCLAVAVATCSCNSLYWRRHLWDTCPPRLPTIYFFQLTLELHKVWQRLCVFAFSNIFSLSGNPPLCVLMLSVFTTVLLYRAE